MRKSAKVQEIREFQAAHRGRFVTTRNHPNLSTRERLHTRSGPQLNLALSIRSGAVILHMTANALRIAVQKLGHTAFEPTIFESAKSRKLQARAFDRNDPRLSAQARPVQVGTTCAIAGGQWLSSSSGQLACVQYQR